MIASPRIQLRHIRILSLTLLLARPIAAKAFTPTQLSSPSSALATLHRKKSIAHRDLPAAFLSATSKTMESSSGDPKYEWTQPTLNLAIPALIASIADPLLSMYDTTNMGKLGANSLAALGVCTSIFYMSFYGFLATKTATTTLVASASTDHEASLVTTTSLQMGIVAGFLIMIGLSLYGAQALAAMGVTATSEIFQPALTYLSIRCLSAPFFLLVTVGEGALRGYGDTKTPLLASCTMAVVVLVLEPLLMFVAGLKIRGAAASMGLSQVAGALVYAFFLKRRNSEKIVAEANSNVDDKKEPTLTKGKIIRTILKANLSMIMKQGSLLFTWAYATKRATHLGAEHAAAHQVALSFWMVFAYILDAVSVSAQVLISKGRKSLSEMRSVTRYMLKTAVAQGFLIMAVIAAMTPYVPGFFTEDEQVIIQLKTLLPIISMQQVFISLTFVMEALAAGGSQFNLLGFGTVISSLLAVILMQRAGSILEIWTGGIIVMFVGRLIVATIGVLNVNQLLPRLGADRSAAKEKTW